MVVSLWRMRTEPEVIFTVIHSLSCYCSICNPFQKDTFSLMKLSCLATPGSYWPEHSMDTYASGCRNGAE